MNAPTIATDSAVVTALFTGRPSTHSLECWNVTRSVDGFCYQPAHVRNMQAVAAMAQSLLPSSLSFARANAPSLPSSRGVRLDQATERVANAMLLVPLSLDE